MARKWCQHGTVVIIVYRDILPRQMYIFIMKKILPILSASLFAVHSLILYANYILSLLRIGPDPEMIPTLLHAVICLVFPVTSIIRTAKNNKASGIRLLNFTFGFLYLDYTVFDIISIIRLLSVGLGSLTASVLDLVLDSAIAITTIVSGAVSGKNDKLRKITFAIGTVLYIALELRIFAIFIQAPPSLFYVAVRLTFFFAVNAALITNLIISNSNSQSHNGSNKVSAPESLKSESEVTMIE